ncbi:hypothetical protein [Algoriphagus jejuensis]
MKFFLIACEIHVIGYVADWNTVNSKNISAEKIVLGVPFNGRMW